MSTQAGWYPDPGGGQGLFRYWDGKAWSAATSPYPTAAPPAQSITGSGGPAGRSPGPAAGGGGRGSGSGGGQPLGSTPPSFGGRGGGQPLGSTPPSFGGGGSAYANYQATEKKRSPVGWWIAGAALVVIIVIVAVLAIRAATGGGGGTVGVPGGQPSQDVCPVQKDVTPSPQPNDGRVHGGPLSYPALGSPWSAVEPEIRLPFGTDVWKQQVMDQENYDGGGSDWVASILVGELQAGDGFFTPEQGSQIVVKCIMGTFYGEGTQVTGDVKRNEAATIDGREAWIVESALSFDIPQLTAKGERLIVAIVNTGSRSGLYYASIPDTRPELVQPARDALKALKVTD